MSAVLKGLKSKIYEIRDPVHGFIKLNDWERQIINHPVFQRLRRIRQLGLTEMVYPGATHTRFEHSLGVMHVATRMFDAIVQRRKDFLEAELCFTASGLARDRVLVRLSCLLHDIGHAPFPHAGEGLMAENPLTKKPYKHENYSAAIVRFLMKDVIENHPINDNHKIRAEDIADFLENNPLQGRSLLWRSLVSSQLDADRADYLLRDSHHIGVTYGHYDLNRLLVTLTVDIDPETGSPTLAVEQGGIHAVEALILARYMMFTQVYFQRTRRAYDHHSVAAVKTLLETMQKDKPSGARGFFPPPDSLNSVKEYLGWDDWRVCGMIKEGLAGASGERILLRKHDRWVYETKEVPDAYDLEMAERVLAEIQEMTSFSDKAQNSWYNFDSSDVLIVHEETNGLKNLKPLSQLSSVVKGLKAVNQTRIYVPFEEKDEARRKVRQLLERTGIDAK